MAHTTRCLSIGIHENRLAAKRGGVRLTPLESYLLTHTTRRPDAPEDAPPTWICPQAKQTYPRVLLILIFFFSPMLCPLDPLHPRSPPNYRHPFPAGNPAKLGGFLLLFLFLNLEISPSLLQIFGSALSFCE
ncbi:hypothetical protein SLEP1_g32217 [Rubroshorea leprosula]|uniref:Uncharacterized protein n=1 Tax=Rubroshorea leprosula TaxID=152421 RepID=A0AAV5KCK3_9ROSI|nr:hypothetical protein SLEP1_g32217 [Rubroshorea leprosula]